jgi:NAD(P)H-hydrate epimerase
MENAGCRVTEYLKEAFAPLSMHRIAVFCGKGNNGGDGFVIARQLWQQKLCAELIVIEADGSELKGDAKSARAMLAASGCPIESSIPQRAYRATIVVDALLGTGVNGPAKGRIAELIGDINGRFTGAYVVAIDLPSGMPTDTGDVPAVFIKAHHTVTFTALKRSQVLSPSYAAMGTLRAYAIGTPDELCESNDRYSLRLVTPKDFAHLFAPRQRDSSKGMYGHVLVVGGSAGKPGAPAMAGLAALRIGAGLVTVASSESAIPGISGYSPALMTEPLAETAGRSVSGHAFEAITRLMKTRTLTAIGPGLGTEPATVKLVRRLYASLEVPVIVDADALNAMAGSDMRTDKIRIFTPHPGEMGRLMKCSTKEIQAARLEMAAKLASDSNAAIVLKGDRTIIAFPDGELWVNPTGSPALATGGTGDVLTGMIAGLVAQHPTEWKRAVIAGVWLHGKAGEIGAAQLGEQALIATDLLGLIANAIEDSRAAV